MSAIIYTAADRGSITDGRLEGTTYAFDVALNRWDSSSARKTEAVSSLSGVTETLLHRIDRTRQVSTVPIKDPALNDQMVEFLDSVSGGEPFIIDLKGSASTAVNPITVMLEGDWSQQRQGRADTFIYNFKIKL